jgi:hypothetical protein
LGLSFLFTTVIFGKTVLQKHDEEDKERNFAVLPQEGAAVRETIGTLAASSPLRKHV